MAEPAPEKPDAVFGNAIDRAHLARMTADDTGLQAEVLTLFDQQAALLLGKIRSADPGAVAALAHTLKGSALGVGAEAVARAAAMVEGAGDAAALNAAIDTLAAEIAAARGEIAGLLASRGGTSPRKG